ncbi:MAG: ABC transporter permease [Gorillibacterium sp.]|nr:ABC transporter permease [Gorillibacterium sp.]
MLILIHSEFLKAKRTYIWWVAAAGGVAIPLLASFEQTGKTLQEDSHMVESLMFTFFYVLFLSLLASYFIVREYSERTVSVLLTYPYSRVKILFSKLAIVFVLILFMYVFQLVALFGIGYLVNADSLTFDFFLMQIQIYGLSTLFQCLLVPFFMAIALWSRNMLFPIVIAIIVGITNIFFVEGSNYVRSPFLSACWPTFTIEMGETVKASSYIMLILFFFLTLGACIWGIRRMKE